MKFRGLYVSCLYILYLNMNCFRDLEKLFDCSYRICRMFVKKYFILKFDFLYKFENCV